MLSEADFNGQLRRARSGNIVAFQELQKYCTVNARLEDSPRLSQILPILLDHLRRSNVPRTLQWLVSTRPTPKIDLIIQTIVSIGDVLHGLPWVYPDPKADELARQRRVVELMVDNWSYLWEWIGYFDRVFLEHAEDLNSTASLRALSAVQPSIDRLFAQLVRVAKEIRELPSVEAKLFNTPGFMSFAMRRWIEGIKNISSQFFESTYEYAALILAPTSKSQDNRQHPDLIPQCISHDDLFDVCVHTVHLITGLEGISSSGLRSLESIIRVMAYLIQQFPNYQKPFYREPVCVTLVSIFMIPWIKLRSPRDDIEAALDCMHLSLHVIAIYVEEGGAGIIVELLRCRIISAFLRYIHYIEKQEDNIFWALASFEDESTDSMDFEDLEIASSEITSILEAIARNSVYFFVLRHVARDLVEAKAVEIKPKYPGRDWDAYVSLRDCVEPLIIEKIQYASLSRHICCNESCPFLPVKATDMKRCIKCLRTYYCSRDCQKQDWGSGHKQACTLLDGREVLSFDAVEMDFVPWLIERDYKRHLHLFMQTQDNGKVATSIVVHLNYTKLPFEAKIAAIFSDSDTQDSGEMQASCLALISDGKTQRTLYYDLEKGWHWSDGLTFSTSLSNY